METVQIPRAPYEPDTLDVISSEMSRFYQRVQLVREAGIGIVRQGERSGYYLYSSDSGVRMDFGSREYRSPALLDLYERIYRKVPFCGSAVDVTADYVLQAGFRVGGSNEKAIEKIEDWMRYMDVVLPGGWNGFLRSVVICAQVFGDAFVEVITPEDPQPTVSMNRPRQPFQITYFKLLHPKTMTVKRDMKGNLEGYEQRPSYLETKTQTPLVIDFPPEKIIHFAFNPVADSAYGTSRFERIRSMLERKLGYEDDAALIVRRYASPIVWYQCGLPNIPATQAQMDKFKTSLTTMRAGDELITSTAVTVEILGAQQKTLDMKPYLEHVDRNLMMGMLTPEVLMGQGQDRTQATAEIEMQSFIYIVKALQRLVKSKIEGEIFTRILGRSKEAMDRETIHDLPHIEWNIIESERDRFQRVSLLIKNDVCKLNEARVMAGLEPIDDKRGNLFLSDILHQQAMELAKEQAKAQAAMRPTGTTAPAGKKPPTDSGTPASTQRKK